MKIRFIVETFSRKRDVNVEDIPARDWLRHRAHKSELYEHKVTADMMTALEVM